MTAATVADASDKELRPVACMQDADAKGEQENPNLAYDFRIIDGERYAGNQIESYTRGLRFVFAPLAPEQGPSIDR